MMSSSQSPPDDSASPPEIVEIYHGSGAGKANDPTLHAMAAAAAVAQEVDAMIGIDGHISADMISEDSLIASSPSPEAPRKQRRTSRSPSIGQFVSMPSSGASSVASARGSTRTAPAGTPVMKIGKVRASSAPRAPGRPASPAPGIRLGDHTFAGGSGSMEQRLAAVEAQQAADHAFFAEVTAAVRGLIMKGEQLTTALQAAPDYSDFDLQTRKELAVIRGKIEADVAHGASATAALFDAKLQELQNAITVLQVSVANLNDREGQMAEYIQSLHGDRPKEGQVLLNSFQYVNAEITSVKERVKMFESSQKAPSMHTSVNTAAALTKLQEQTSTTAAIFSSTFAELHGAANLMQQRVEAIEGKLLAYDETAYVQQTYWETNAPKVDLCSAFQAGVAAAAHGGGGDGAQGPDGPPNDFG